MRFSHAGDPSSWSLNVEDGGVITCLTPGDAKKAEMLFNSLHDELMAARACIEAARDLESWLGKVVGSDNAAQVEIRATDIGGEGTRQRLQALADALRMVK